MHKGEVMGAFEIVSSIFSTQSLISLRYFNWDNLTRGHLDLHFDQKYPTLRAERVRNEAFGPSTFEDPSKSLLLGNSLCF